MQEPDFLQAIRGAGYPFEWYRPLILLPRESGGQARALNALSDQEIRQLLVPDLRMACVLTSLWLTQD